MAASSSSGLAATNLLANGSFETGDFTDWTLGGAATDGFPAVVIPYNSTASYPGGAFGEPIPPATGSLSPDPAGNFAAYFVSDTATETLSQTVFLTPGVYSIGFSAYSPRNGYANTGDAEFSGSIAGVPLANFSVHSGPAAMWRNFDGSVDIHTAGVYTASFSFNTSLVPSADVVIDQAFVVAGGVPELSTWAMLVLGLAGLGFAGSRQGRAAEAP